jgi:hypothetical protein
MEERIYVEVVYDENACWNYPECRELLTAYDNAPEWV